MNSIERMKAAIELKPVDRVPNAPFYEAPICTYFGSSMRAALMESQAMVDAHLQAVEEFQFDWAIMGMNLIGGIIPAALGCRVVYPENELPQILETAVKTIDDVEKVANSDIFTDHMEEFLKGVSKLHTRLKGQVPLAAEYISPFTIATRLRGTNEIMSDMYENPGLVKELQEAIVPLNISVGKALADAGVEYIFYGADMECPVLLSPNHYKEFVHEPTSKVCNELSRLGLKVLPHMCGNIVKSGIVDMLLEMDIHGIMPGNLTQENVFDIRELKEKVKERICVFDNINPNGPLLIGNPEEVKKKTREHLERAKGMSGYIFSTAGTSAPTTPKENFTAMNNEVLNFEWA